MTQPLNPGVPPGPHIDPGDPDPVRTETLGDPAPEVLDPPQPTEEPDLPEPTTEEDAAPLDSQVILGDGENGCTTFSYLRELTDSAVIVHLMVTPDGPDPFVLSRVSATLVLRDQALETAVLPDIALEAGQMWEADLTFEAQVAELAPGEAVLQLQLDDHPEVFAAV